MGRVGGKVSDEVTPKVNFALNWGCKYDSPPICGLQCMLEMGENPVAPEMVGAEIQRVLSRIFHLCRE